MNCATRIRPIVEAMRAVDRHQNCSRRSNPRYSADGSNFNETVLSQAETVQFLSFHLYQPGQSASEEIESDELFVQFVQRAQRRTVLRLAEQIKRSAAGRNQVA
jgi:hypothetical protein